MKKIYLFCSAGMSTSLLASKMQKVADEHKIPVEVKAFPDSMIKEIMEKENPDVLLLGPQVKHKYKSVVEQYGHTKKPIEVINQEAYGLMDGEKILKRAIKLIKESKEKE